jgi:UDP-glucose 4-epimerase
VLYKETILDAGRFTSLVEELRPDVICHLAAQADAAASVDFAADDARINVLGTVNVLEAARLVNARMLFCSSSAVYGENPSMPFSESTAPMPISPYGAAKYCSEQYVGLYGRLYGVQHVILRFGNVYGPRQNLDREPGVISAFCSRAVQGRRITVFGDGKQTRDYIYVGDCVSAMLAAMDCGLSGTWNIATEKEVSILDLIAAIDEIVPLGEPEFAPARLGEPLRSVLASASAERDLGWRPATSLAAGVRAVLDWIKEGAPDRGPC